jgi:uncharacterized membrane protein
MGQSHDDTHNVYPPQLSRSPREADRRLRTLTHLIYALYAVSWPTGGISVLIAVIINYVKRPDTLGTPYQAHFEWQIRTFWWALLGHLIGVALFFALIGVPIFAAASVWALYRIIKGWLHLYDHKPLLTPRAWF